MKKYIAPAVEIETLASIQLMAISASDEKADAGKDVLAPEDLDINVWDEE